MLNVEKKVEMATCWFAAEHALRHVESNRIQIDRTFERYNIGKSQYAIYAGFDESRIQGCYLEQIHIFSLSAIPATSPLLMELAKVLSPFSSILVTESSSYRLPVYKDDGTLWDFSDFLFEMAPKHTNWHTSTAAMHPTVISLSQTRDNQSQEDAGSGDTEVVEKDGSKEKGEGMDKDNGNGAQNPKDYSRGDDHALGHPTNPGNKVSGDPDPEGEAMETTNSPKIAFDIDSSIYSTPNGNLAKTLQRIKTIGELTIKMGKESTEPKCQVRFTKLQFGNEILIPGVASSYRQFHCHITIDSRTISWISDDNPPPTRAFGDGTMVTVPSTDENWRRYFRASISQKSPSANCAAGSDGRADEESASSGIKQFNSPISQLSSLGVASWGFVVDDPDQQEGGTILAGPVLPTATFYFYIQPDNNTTHVSEHIDVEVVSYWSILPHQAVTSYNDLLRMLVSPTSNDSPVSRYTNLCQMTVLKIPSDLKQNSHYCATTCVENTGKCLHFDTDALHPGSESVQIKNEMKRRTSSNPFKYGDVPTVRHVEWGFRDNLSFSDNMWIGPSPQRQRDAK